MQRSLEGKAVVVTGAGRGIGAAYARHAAAHGARVVVSDIAAEAASTVADEIRAAGGESVACRADVSSWGDAEALIERCVAEFGVIDGLVNNAGLLTVARVDEMDEASLRKVFEVNALGTAFCAVHASRRMVAQGHGSIVNVTSGAHIGKATLGAYGATKGAIASFTYAWAVELGPLGVRVNAIAPMATGAMGDVVAKYYEAKGVTLSRNGPELPAPASNAPVVTYLLSDAAKGVNGQVVRIDGTTLSLMVHPSMLEPALECDEWTFEGVRDAFDSELRAAQFPLGVVSVRASIVGAGQLPGRGVV